MLPMTTAVGRVGWYDNAAEFGFAAIMPPDDGTVRRGTGAGDSRSDRTRSLALDDRTERPPGDDPVARRDC
jgi:hypothetical protein